MRKEINSIAFEANLKGRGIVNFDGKNQKKFLKSNHKDKYDFESLANDNATFCKKSFTEDGFKIKISSECLKRAIYGEDIDGINSSIMYSPILLNNFMATPHAIMKGFMFAGKETTLKRKSVITLTDAEQTNDAIPYMEFFSKGDENRKTSETSLYASETCGEIKYKTEGFLSIKRLQFISSSPFFDRESVKDDELNDNGIYWQALNRNFGVDVVKGTEHAHFTINKNIFVERLAETGLLLSQTLQKQLVKDYFTRMLAMRIERSNAYCELESLKVKLIFNGIQKDEDEDFEWVEIKSIKDIDNIIDNYDFKQYYEKADSELVTETMDFIQSFANEKSGTKAKIKSLDDKIKKIKKEIDKDFAKEDKEGKNAAYNKDEELQELIKEKEEISKDN